MPLYEYKCTKCGTVSEFLESRESVGEHACPQCGAQPMERIFSAFGVEVGRSSASGGGSPCAGGSCSGGSCPFA